MKTMSVFYFLEIIYEITNFENSNQSFFNVITFRTNQKSLKQNIKAMYFVSCLFSFCKHIKLVFWQIFSFEKTTVFLILENYFH